MLGVVWDHGGGGKVAPDRLRAVIARLPGPPLPASIRRFIDWVAEYTLSSPGMVLRMVLRSAEALDEARPRIGIRYRGTPPARMTEARRRALGLLDDGLAWPKRDLLEAAGISPGVVDTLVEQSVLEVVELPPLPPYDEPDPDHDGPKLSPPQAEAAQMLRAAVAKRSFSAILLDGVTGAGKTEVYFEAIAEALRAGRQALVLLPEIALTTQFLERFAARFGAAPAEWHSGLTQSRREACWRAVHRGEAMVVVGARSALFLPFADLGLIVVDEEHDAAYKQEDRVTYNARDMAVVRAHLGAFPVVLSSATPSLETRVNADQGRYDRAVLPARFGAREVPPISLIDMRAEPPERGHFLSPALVAGAASALEEGGQALFFLNRRGYAPLTLCRACGHRFMCPDCSAWLVEHRFRERLVCHHCGYSIPLPPSCPKCGSADSLTPCGPGVERIAEEVAEIFPDKRLTILSSDMTGGVARMRDLFSDIEEGRTDIIVGTQLVAKGHHFPRLTFVGVVDGDIGLGQGDLRAGERTFQLLHQVVGRAGRGNDGGKGFIQTFLPEHPVMQALASGDEAAFYALETGQRERYSLPPFGRFAALIISGRDKERVIAYARRLAARAPRHEAVGILGPVEAPLALVRGRHRMRLLLKAPRNFAIQAYLRAWMSAAGSPGGGVRLDIDIDPYSFL
jgi:primosomal protein N' (replication factor Y)